MKFVVLSRPSLSILISLRDFRLEPSLNARIAPLPVIGGLPRLSHCRGVLIAAAVIAFGGGARVSADDAWQIALRDSAVRPANWMTQTFDRGVPLDDAHEIESRLPTNGLADARPPRERWFGEFDWLATATSASQPQAAKSWQSMLEGPAPELNLDSDVTLVGLPSPFILLHLISGGRIRGEYLDDFDENSRVGGSLILDSPWGIGFDSEAYYWTEDAPAGGDRNFSSGDMNAIWRFGAGTPIRFQSGLGANWLDFDESTEYGFNTTYGLEIQVKHWLAFGGSLDWGRVGGEELFHGRITTSLMFGTLEVYAGYDIYEVGWIEREGLIAGIGLWF